MKFLFIVVLCLANCQSQVKYKLCENIRESSDSIISNSNIASQPKSITFPSLADFSRSDSIALTFGREILIATKNGELLKSGRIIFKINSIDKIGYCYIFSTDGDYIIFFVSSDEEGGSSHALRIMPTKNLIKWEVPLFSFNLTSPAIVDEYAYLSTLGFVGKLNLKNGKFVWKFEGLCSKSSKFFPPKFLPDSLVLFPVWPSGADGVLIDDARGRILKIWE